MKEEIDSHIWIQDQINDSRAEHSDDAVDSRVSVLQNKDDGDQQQQRQIGQHHAARQSAANDHRQRIAMSPGSHKSHAHQNGQQCQDGSWEMWLGFVGGANDDGKKNKTEGGKALFQIISAKSAGEHEGDDYSENSPAGSIGAVDQIKFCELFRMIEIKSRIAAEVDEMKPGTDFEECADGIKP